MKIRFMSPTILVVAVFFLFRRSQRVDATLSDLEVVLMRQGRRYGLSAEQKSVIWERWKTGESLHEIGRAFGKDHGSIQFLLAQHGGIAPAVRRRSQRTLTLAEREEISRGIASGASIREIAGGLGRAASTVSRRWHATAGGQRIEPVKLISRPGRWLCDPRRAGSQGTGSCG